MFRHVQVAQPIILETEILTFGVPGQPRQNEIPYFKINLKKKTGGVDEVVDHVPTKHTTLRSNPSTFKKQKQNDRERKILKQPIYIRI
jgi:hypothetical protein